MKDNAFLDTNIIAYLYSKDETDKRNICRRLIRTYNCIISTQVLNEFSNVLIKKFRMNHDAVLEILNELNSLLSIIDVTLETIQKAVKVSKRFKYSYFDSLIIASAVESQSSVLFSEDLQNGFVIDKNITMKNPFQIVLD